MKKFWLCVFIFFSTNAAFAQKIPSPSEFLEYELGSKFSYHHKVVAYFEAVAKISDKVKILPYGKTNERRPLMVAFVSSSENLKNLEQIRKNNLINAGQESGNVEGKNLPIVWLSYNVHGNEASSLEAAMAVYYELLTSQDEKVKNWLNEMVIAIDPCINPDGRDRYANWYNQVENYPNDVSGDTREHREPWPGGRFNHYLFDLNRDWAWQTQVESQQRLKVYNQWLPHVHVDFHEMGYDSPYFFAPAAKPYYEDITDWQREFQQHIGRNNAKYFDKEGWLYYTKEVFDLFYPSYGDTYPTYNGGIGFTYEQGGSGRAGLGIMLPNKDTLTLKDRYLHHYTTSIATIETSFNDREKLLKEFKKYFSDAVNNPKGTYKTYVIKKSNDPARIQALLQLLDNQQIKYGYPSTAGGFKGFEYLKNKDGNCNLDKEDIVISAYQPKSVLVKALFEPKPKLEDSLTYDLTAWALPYAYELESFALREKVGVSDKAVTFEKPELKNNAAYAYLVEWKDFSDVQFLASALKQNIKVRYANEKFVYQKTTFKRGTLMIIKGDNPHLGNNFDKTIQQLAQKHQQTLFTTETGFMDEGKDFGSDEQVLIQAPKVALVLGEDVSPTEGGAVWHYFEQSLQYPLSILSTNNLSNADLKKYQVIILAAGNYGQHTATLLNFASNGGKLIVLEDAMEAFAQDSRTALHKSLNKLEAEDKKDTSTTKDAKWLRKYDERSRKSLSEGVSGAIYQVQLDESHPLAFGEDNTVHLIKGNRAVYPYLQSGWNVGVFNKEAHVAGFVGYKLKEKLKNTLAIGVENQGQGKIIYFTDTPIFRGFWHSGKLLLGNAIFLLD